MRTVFRLIYFVRKRWIWLVGAFVCLVLSTAFSLAIPRLLGNGIDTALRATQSNFFGVAMDRQTALTMVAVAVIVASLLRGIAAYYQTFLSQVVSQKVTYDVRNAFYQRLQRLSFAYHDHAQTGQLMSRATVDVEAIRQFFAMGIVGIAQLLVLAIAVVWLLVSIDWRLALLTFIFLPLIGWRAWTFSANLRPIWLKIQQLMAVLGTILEEALTGIRVVKAFTRQDFESRKFSDQAGLLYEEQVGVAKEMALNVPMMFFLMSMPTVVILWYGGHQVVAGTLTIGQLTQFILYLGMLVMPVRRLGMIGNLLSRMQSAGGRILEILDTESAVKEKPNAIELEKVAGAVEFEGVSFGYDTASPTLENVSFKAEPGHLVALLGGSGSGKSTIANLIPRFYDVTAGTIKVDGTDIRDVTLASLRQNVGIAQQDIFLFSGTIRDNIRYGAVSASQEQVEEVARAAHLHDFILTLPDGYDTWVGERGLTLSGGEKQRLSIARTLLINPSILIMDDSTSSVDAETEHLIRQALARLIQNRTTFIITHRLPIIKNADLILMLDKGRVIEMGKHDELMEQEGVYYQIYKSQLLTSVNSGEQYTED